jgi:hypothetical protein
LHTVITDTASNEEVKHSTIINGLHNDNVLLNLEDAQSRFLSLLQQNFSRNLEGPKRLFAPSSLLFNRHRESFSWVKRPKHESEHLFPYSDKGKNEWSWTYSHYIPLCHTQWQLHFHNHTLSIKSQWLIKVPSNLKSKIFALCTQNKLWCLFCTILRASSFCSLVQHNLMGFQIKVIT